MSRILAVSDVVDPVLYDYFDADRWRSEAIDLLISCGDLPADFLSYLVSRFNVPLFYVPGNHDGAYQHEPPEGAQSIDGKLVEWNGLRILGLGGCRWYNGGPYQYHELEMAKRLLVLEPRILLARGVDVVVTHAPPAEKTEEQSDAPANATDHVHQGFQTFRTLIQTHHPRVFLHGHTHLGYGLPRRRVTTLDGTQVIDVYKRYVIDV